ncbi:FAD-dependent oxidoreductase [Actinomadura sp. CNU-125]|uniref:FAD-binding oxidoreductase n=1 Tax=Actinomadura sp. CNU-125 TaxID=1904961 RepID=UPI0009F897E8
MRAAGTSLNGQAQGDDILLDVRRHFDRARVEEDGRILRSAPGVVLSRANARLARYGRVLGPDPASGAAACVGGVVANNSSGMTSGVHANAYRTVESLRVVLPSGTRVDTAAPDATGASPGTNPSWSTGSARSATRSAPIRSSPRGSGASSRSRTPTATGSTPSSTATPRRRSSAGSSSAPRGRWDSWRRSASVPSPTCAGRRPPSSTSPTWPPLRRSCPR